MSTLKFANTIVAAFLLIHSSLCLTIQNKKESKFMRTSMETDNVITNHPRWVETADSITDKSTSLIRLTFAIKHQNVEKLEPLLLDVSTPGSPNYGKHMTLNEIHNLVKPKSSHIKAVESFLRSHSITDYEYSHGFIRATVNIKLAETMLGTTYKEYKHRTESRSVFRCATYSVPHEVASAIDFVAPTVSFPLEHQIVSINSTSPELKSNLRGKGFQEGKSTISKQKANSLEETSAPSHVPTTLPTEEATVAGEISKSPQSITSELPSFVPTLNSILFPIELSTSISTSSPSISNAIELKTSSPTASSAETSTFFPSELLNSSGFTSKEPNFNILSLNSSISIPPSRAPSQLPTFVPSFVPTIKPSVSPTRTPTFIPTLKPTSKIPTCVPSKLPTFRPTIKPSVSPTRTPTFIPTFKPSSKIPTCVPSRLPTFRPTIKPSSYPTSMPTAVPSLKPTSIPTVIPTMAPSRRPTYLPTMTPSLKPTTSFIPSYLPSGIPTISTYLPTIKPSFVPSINPTAAPSNTPITNSPSLSLPTCPVGTNCPGSLR